MLNKEQLRMQIREAYYKLKQAEKAIDEGELPYANIYIQIAKELLMKLGGINATGGDL